MNLRPILEVTEKRRIAREKELCKLYNCKNFKSRLERCKDPYAPTDIIQWSYDGILLSHIEVKIRSDSYFGNDGWTQDTFWCQASKLLYDYREKSPHWFVSLALSKDKVYWTHDLFHSLTSKHRRIYSKLVAALYEYHLSPKATRIPYRELARPYIEGDNIDYDPSLMGKGTLEDFFEVLSSLKEREECARIKRKRVALVDRRRRKYSFHL